MIRGAVPFALGRHGLQLAATKARQPEHTEKKKKEKEEEEEEEEEERMIRKTHNSLFPFEFSSFKSPAPQQQLKPRLKCSSTSPANFSTLVV